MSDPDEAGADFESKDAALSPETTEWDLDNEPDVPVSALEHYSYCPRQCALIHVEGVFEENVFTIRGTQVHERVDSLDDKPIEGVPVFHRGLPLYSRRLGLVGKADLVELRAEGPYPVEYKAGRRHGPHVDLQLCAQALCLEEMLGQVVSRGAVFHHATRRRREVVFTAELRARTEELIGRVRATLRSSVLPPALNDEHCPGCSLRDTCMPAVVAEPQRMQALQSELLSQEVADA